MATLEEVARVLLDDGLDAVDRALRARAMWSELLLGGNASQLEAPRNAAGETASLAAALGELLASRLGQAPPAWTSGIGAAPAPRFLMSGGQRARARMRALAPLPLRRRNFFAPPNYLQAA